MVNCFEYSTIKLFSVINVKKKIKKKLNSWFQVRCGDNIRTFYDLCSRYQEAEIPAECSSCLCMGYMRFNKDLKECRV